MATLAEIKSWLAANPNATDAFIATAMDRYGVTPKQMAQATGLGLSEINSRYQDRSNVRDSDVTDWLRKNPRASDVEIAAAMNQYDVSPEQMSRVTGLPLSSVQQRFQAAVTDPSYTGLFEQLNQTQTGNVTNPYGYTWTPQTMATRQDQPQVAMNPAGINDPTALAAQQILNREQTYALPSQTFGSGLFQTVANAPNVTAARVPSYTGGASGNDINVPDYVAAMNSASKPTSGGGGGGGVSDADVSAWLKANPNASDAAIRAAMDQYGVGVDQMARVTGLGSGVVQSRYDAAKPYTSSAPAGGYTADGSRIETAPSGLSDSEWSAVKQMRDEYGWNNPFDVNSARAALGGVTGAVTGALGITPNYGEQAMTGLMNYMQTGSPNFSSSTVDQAIQNVINYTPPTQDESGAYTFYGNDGFGFSTGP